MSTRLYSLSRLLLVVACIFASNVAADRAFKLGIRDTFMIAHSFHGHAAFGPAGGMHGATYTCDVEFGADALCEETNWVMDIGRAGEILSEVLANYNLKNLDEVFSNGELTTTEFMCKQIYEDLCARLSGEFKGDICVKLWESHKAWASYTGSI
jgi:6-pyruvoyltetrahydropterin/6-carboxytetrahydropterin synthase